MTRPAGLNPTQMSAARTISGVIAAESATLSLANFPLAQALDCYGYETIFVGVEITAGTNPTATIEVLAYDPDGVASQVWKKLLVGSPPGVTAASAASQKTSALDGTSLCEVRVCGRKQIMLRVDAVTNATNTTAMTILAMPGARRAPGDARI